MSLATRCANCGTVFRVVQDQLKVSEGWVRCGRCNEVFNALEALFDLEREAPPEWTPRAAPAPADTAASGAPPAPAHAAVPPFEAPFDSPFNTPFDAQPSPPTPAVDAVDVNLGHDGAVDFDVSQHGDDDTPQQPLYRRQSDSTPSMRIDERDRLDFPDARFESVPAENVVETSEDNANPAGVAVLLPLGEDAVVSAPEFLRHAQRRARWQSPLVRGALSLVALLLVGGLLLQIGHQFRDTIAARWPELKPALVAWCDVAGCKIQPARHIEDIAVENTALTRDESLDTFRFAVTLRNRAPTALALPSVDLSLTDAAGLLVARRMLSPADFRIAAPATIAAGAELPLQLVLSTGDARVTGYTVEIFYP